MFSTTTTTSDHYSNTMSIPSLLTTKWKYNNIEVAPNCPRCASSNTKFCYYNNYSFSQPRYFCKGCRRYWTKGGSLRNVPVGGGCRKSRRARAASQKARNPNYADVAPVAMSAKESNSDTCIDMAAVFANYVNQNVEIEESSSTGSSSDNVQPLEDLIGDRTVAQVSTCQDVNSQQFVYQDCSGLELQEGVLCDQDMLWSEGTTVLSNHALHQPMVQVEDCGLFAPDYDQLRISESLVTDNWASFDISSYDFYSTP